jgi:hypothetical protein
MHFIRFQKSVNFIFVKMVITNISLIVVRQPPKHRYSFLMNKSRRLWKVKPTTITCCVHSMKRGVAAVGLGEVLLFCGAVAQVGPWLPHS